MTKKYSIGLATLLLALAGFAFATVNSEKAHLAQEQQALTTFYYRYLGTGTDLADFQTRNNWTVGQDPQSESNCSGSGLPCLVSSTIADIDDFVAAIDETNDVMQHVELQKNP